MPIYLCPLTRSPPRIPVLANNGITYDFVSIAQTLLSQYAHDRSMLASIKTLIYNRSVSEMNDELMDEVYPLTHEEKNEIALLYKELKRCFPELKIYGVHEPNVRALIQTPKSELNGPVGFDFLSQARHAEDLFSVHFLLDNGCNPNQANARGQTQLYLAASNGNIEITIALLAAGANPNLATHTGYTPLHRAVRRRNIKIIMALLAAGADPNRVPDSGTTVLCEAVEMDYTELVHILLDKGADPNLADVYHRRPLNTAIGKRNFIPIALALLAAGADPNLANTKGEIPLYFAAGANYKEDFWFLLTAGTYLNKRNIFGETPLFFAAKLKNTEYLSAFLAAGSNPNQINNDGFTPLLVAVSENNIQNAAVLLDWRADPNLANREGKTPLWIAAKNRATEIVSILLSADSRIPLNQTIGTARETQLCIAILFGHLDVAKIIATSQYPSEVSLHEYPLLVEPFSDIKAKSDSDFVRDSLSYATILTFYLEQLIKNPEFMYNALKKNTCFLREFIKYREEILNTIRTSHQVFDGGAHYPLYALLTAPYEPKQKDFFSFFNGQSNIATENIQVERVENLLSP